MIQHSQGDSNGQATLEEGTWIMAYGLPSWRNERRVLHRFALQDGWIVLEQIPGNLLRIALYDCCEDVLLDQGISCPILLIDDNRAVVSTTWNNRRFKDLRVNANTVWAADDLVPTVPEVRITASKSISLTHPERHDYSLDNDTARSVRLLALESRKPKAGREAGGREYAFSSLADEIAQISDILNWIKKGKLAHIPGLMARVRLLVYGRPFGLLQECAAWQNAYLPVYTHVLAQEPLDIDDKNSIDLSWSLNGSPLPTIAHPNIIDFDNWLRLRCLSLGGRDYSNLDIIREIGDTVAAHRDPYITPAIARMVKDSVDVKYPMNHLGYFSVMVGEMVLAMSEGVASNEEAESLR